MGAINSIKIEHPFHEDYCYTGVLMTTPIKLVASHHRYLAAQGFQYMSTLVQRLDYFDPQSELSRLNQAAGLGPQKVSSLLYRLLHIAKVLELKTNSVFRADFESQDKNAGFVLMNNLQVQLNSNTRLNLGGIAKGYIVDKTFRYLKSAGAKNILVEAGGDIRAQSIEQSWKIGLFNPLQPPKPFGSISLSSGAVVTSGTYARKNMLCKSTHFFNTHTWSYYTETPYVSVTVEGPFAAIAEVYAKCLLMGHKLVLPKSYKALGVTAKYKVQIL